MSNSNILVIDSELRIQDKYMVAQFSANAGSTQGGELPHPQQPLDVQYIPMKEYMFHSNYSEVNHLEHMFPNLHTYFQTVRSKTSHGQDVLHSRIDFKVTPAMEEVIYCVAQPLRNRIDSMARRHVNELHKQELMWSKCNDELNELSIKYFHLQKVKQKWFYKLGSFLGLI